MQSRQSCQGEWCQQSGCGGCQAAGSSWAVGELKNLDGGDGWPHWPTWCSLESSKGKCRKCSIFILKLKVKILRQRRQKLALEPFLITVWANCKRVTEFPFFEAESSVLFYIQLSSSFKLFDLEKFQVKGSLDSWINYYFKFKNRSTLFWWIGSNDLLIDYF